MNRLRNIFTCLCPVLLLAWMPGRAQTIVWSDGFETNAAGNATSRWTNSGAWHISAPTAGPAFNGAGYRTHSGARCASTQNYAYNQDGRIVCTNYLNGGSSLLIPDASTSPTLTFWHWVNLANALGYVELSSGTNGWQQISPTYLNVTSGGAWLQNSIDLSAHAGQSVQIAFHFTSGGCCGNALGWYVDDVAVTMLVTAPPQLIVPDPQTLSAGTTNTLTVYATNSLLPNAQYNFKLLSPSSGVSLNNSNGVGVLTFPISQTQLPSTNTITVKVTDNSAPPLVATNSFVVTVVNPWLPVLTVPGTQTIYAGQTLSVTNSAVNDFFSTFTFALVSGLTNNLDVSDLPVDGVLTWATTPAQPVGSYTNFIKATDNNAPFLSATNSFVIIVSTNPPPPVLTVPARQTVYAGQTLTVFISATNTFLPADTYSYKTNSAPAGVVLDAVSGKLTWTPKPTQSANTLNTISVQATDINYPGVSVMGSFQVLASSVPFQPPTFTVPPRQTISATNGFR